MRSSESSDARLKASRWSIWLIGLVLGPFLGTVGGELLAGKNVSSSLRGGLGALLGFVLCVGIKVASVGLYTWWYFAAIRSYGSA